MAGFRQPILLLGAAILGVFVVMALGIAGKGSDGGLDSARIEPESGGAAARAMPTGAPDTSAASDQPPESLAASLSATTEENRSHILRLSVVGAGYDCDEVASAGAVGSTGQVWRVRCRDALVYELEIDEFDRVRVTPTPYGDFRDVEGTPFPSRTIVVPESE